MLQQRIYEYFRVMKTNKNHNALVKYRNEDYNFDLEKAHVKKYNINQNTNDENLH